MIRKLATIAAVVCVATVCTALFAVALLWYRGQLTADAISMIAAILRGEDLESMTGADDAEGIDPSANDVTRLRIGRILSIENREKEVDQLLGMVNERADILEASQKAFAARTKAFDDRLNDLETRWLSEATEQARAVLAAQQPAAAVANLSILDLEESVLLVRGLPEKTIARILQQFAQSNVEEEIKRGREIFEAITRGEPRRSLLEETAAADGVPPAR